MENNNFADFQLNLDREHLDVFKQLIRVRCPQCFKLFSIKTQSIAESRPKFACSGCSTQFWIPFPECMEQDELLGFPVSWLDQKQNDIEEHIKTRKPVGEQRPCPKCGSDTDLNAKECGACGVIIQQYLESLEDLEAGFQVPKQLRQHWKALIDNYEDDSLHAAFVSACQKEKALDYASYRYSRVLKACPSDEITQKMQHQITELMQASIKPVEPPKSSKIVKKAHRPIRLSSIIIIAGLLLMATGYFLPAFRNIVGLGAATMFLAVAVRVYLDSSNG